MRGEPVEMLGAVVDGVEPPQKADAVLEAMAPVDEEVAEQDDFEDLEPPGLRGDGVAEVRRDEAAECVAEVRQHPEDEAAPEEVLAEEEAEVGEPGGPEEALPGFRGEGEFEGPKDEDEEETPEELVDEFREFLEGLNPEDFS